MDSPIVLPKRIHRKPEHYHALATKKGYSWIGVYPKYVKDKTLWRCWYGHIWEATYDTLSAKRWRGCPECAELIGADKRRKKPSDYHDMANGHGFIWVGPEVRRVIHKTGWQCRRGHTFYATYNGIQTDKGCAKCSHIETGDRSRLTSESYIKIAIEHGVEWIGEHSPANNQEKTKWRCAVGHEWERDYSCMKEHPYCPTCKGYINGHYASNPQRYIHRFVGGELNYKYGKRASIDIAIIDSENKIAIEYDGWQWHKNRGASDLKKRNELIGLGWRVLVVKGSLILPDIEKIKASILALIGGGSYIEIVMPDWGSEKNIGNKSYDRNILPV